MHEGQFVFSPEVFGADDRQSVEAVVGMLDQACAQDTEDAAEDILYDFCVAYQKEYDRQGGSLSKEDADKRLRVIVQWYAEHARTAEGERLLPEETAADINENWDEWLNGPEPLFAGFFKKKKKHAATKPQKAQPTEAAQPAEAENAEIEEPEELPAEEPIDRAEGAEEPAPRPRKKTNPAILGMIACFVVGLCIGWAAGHIGGGTQPADQTAQTAQTGSAVDGNTAEQPQTGSEGQTDGTDGTAVNITVVMTQSMNVREAPTTEDEDNILTTLAAGEQVVVLSQADENGWVQISCEDMDGDPITGYIMAVFDGQSTYTPADASETNA